MRWYTGLAPRRRLVVTTAMALAVALAVTVGVLATRDRHGRSARAVVAPDWPFVVVEPSGPVTLIGPSGPPVIFLPPPAPVGTVLLVPGYGGSQTALRQLAARLERAGRRAVVVDLPGGGTGDLHQQAQAVQNAAARQLAAGSPWVDVVGYSAGGVVVRLWLADYGGQREARRVVSLGAPLHGAALAAVGAALAPGACPVACQQLVPGSSLLDYLNRLPLPDGLSWMSIWTLNDKTVDPPDSARLSGAVNVVAQSICPRETISHSGLPTDPLVVGLVLTALSGDTMATPVPGDCSRLIGRGR